MKPAAYAFDQEFGEAMEYQCRLIPCCEAGPGKHYDEGMIAMYTQDQVDLLELQISKLRETLRSIVEASTDPFATQMAGAVLAIKAEDIS